MESQNRYLYLQEFERWVRAKDVATKILVADDSVVSRHLLTATLEKWGYSVVVACDGVEALNLLKSDSAISFAVLDWVMPGLTGPEVIRRIREGVSGISRYVYSIILTAKGLREDLIEGLESGADDYMVKPFDQHELKVRIRAGQRILDHFGVTTDQPLKPIQMYSCFISHSSKDVEFASRLNADLRANGVTCFYAPEDLKPGDKFRWVIDESIKINDKLLLILSEHSVESKWVETEVEAALEDEQRRIQTIPQHLRGNVTVLFPIRLDDSPFESSEAWVGDIRRQRHIGDFRDWRDPIKYDKAFARLLDALKKSDELDKEAVKTRKKLSEQVKA
jgi:DNA-binding response OmpR family regulator